MRLSTWGVAIAFYLSDWCPMRLAQLSCLVASLVVNCSGCALLNSPSMEGQSVLVQGDPERALQPNAAAETFQKIKQAKRENAVILQVQGDPEPVRILPLPQDGESVFVSDLLKQTGVFRKFGRVHAELYRDSTNLMDGVRMRVDIQGGDRITPGTDYALRPGDRLLVRRVSTTALGDAMEEILPGNAMRALGFGR